MDIPENLTRKQAAELAGVAPPALNQALRSKNPPPRNPDGTYPRDAFVAWLRTRRPDSRRSSEYESDISRERARLTHHQANLAALKEAELRNTLLDAQAVADRWEHMRQAARDRLLRLPVAISQAAHGRDPIAIERECERLIHDALRELSEGLPR